MKCVLYDGPLDGEELMLPAAPVRLRKPALESDPKGWYVYDRETPKDVAEAAAIAIYRWKGWEAKR